MIRAIPIGETVKLQIWREGQVQELSAKIAPVPQQAIAMTMTNPEQQHEVGFRGDAAAAGSDLSQRVMQLERQLGTVTQELQQLREQMTQMQTRAAVPRLRIETNIELPPHQPARPSDSRRLRCRPAVPPAIDQPVSRLSNRTATSAGHREASDDDSLFK